MRRRSTPTSVSDVMKPWQRIEALERGNSIRAICNNVGVGVDLEYIQTQISIQGTTVRFWDEKFVSVV